MGRLSFGPYAFDASNPDKVLFPEAGITKKNLIDYYRRIAPVMRRHVEDRPITMHRFPEGIEGESFYQKDRPDHFPDWVDSVSVRTEAGRVRHILVSRAADLAFLANQACITPHVWLSRADSLRKPDRIVFDLDPGGDTFEPVVDTARALRDRLADTGVVPFVATTGSSGLHVTVPIRKGPGFEQARAFAEGIAREVVRDDPEGRTLEHRKDQRDGKLYIDINRNAYGQMVVAPYAVRALPAAPVATPLDWDELTVPNLGPRRYTIANLFRRLANKEDPWARIQRRARDLHA